MRRLIFLALTFLIPLSVWADEDYYAMALKEKANAKIITAKYEGEVKSLVKNQGAIIAPYQKDAEMAENKAEDIMLGKQKTIDSDRQYKKPMSSILVFVSFSMPESSIIAKLQDADKINADVVIKGLIDNSFKKTMAKMNELIQQSGGGGVELNPLWFKKFHILAVPAVVVVPEGSVCYTQSVCDSSKDYDVIYGDISIAAALKEIRNQSNFGNHVAESAVRKLQGISNA